MNKKHTLIDYEARVSRVVTYIHDHLDDDLNMDQLAEIACFSTYHWHRIYRTMFGETAAQTVRWLRLCRAAGALIRSDEPVEKIALKAGYTSVEAFHRAFAKDYHLPPAAYRRRVNEPFSSNQTSMEDEHMPKVEIRETKPLKLVTITHKGSYLGIGKVFENLFVWVSYRNLVNEHTRSLGVYFDDPGSVPPEDLRSRAGIVVDDNFIPDDDKVELYELAGGRVAVMLHKGPYVKLEKSYNWFYSIWLPQSGEQPADAPTYEEYLNSPQTTPAAELLTEICMPLRD